MVDIPRSPSNAEPVALRIAERRIKAKQNEIASSGLKSHKVSEDDKIMKPHVKAQAEKIRAKRKEATRLVSMLNKRLRRLEANDMTDNPAYRGAMSRGGYFSVKGKTNKEVALEMQRMKRFMNAKTSTVRGMNSYLREMAKDTGIKYKKISELRAMRGKFFTIASQIEQYLRNVQGSASAIGYQQIWNEVNTYVEQQRIDLSGTETDLDNIISNLAKSIEMQNDPELVVANGHSKRDREAAGYFSPKLKK